MSHRKYSHNRHTVSAVNRGYSDAGASTTKRALKGFTASSGSPQEDIDYNNYTLRQRSRMLYMASPIATAALKRQRTSIVGGGLKLKCAIDRESLGMTQEQAEAWQKKTQAEFEMWASNKRACDAAGMNNFYGLQQLVMLTYPMSGDVFALFKRYEPTPLMPYSLRIQLIEADRIRTPYDKVTKAPFCTTGKANNGNTIYDGVEVDGNGLVVAYHIANTYPQTYSTEKTTEFTRVEAYGKLSGLPNILHIMDSERPDQYRGVPYLAQVIEPLLQMRRYTEAEIMAAIVQSFYTAFITTEAGASEMPYNEIGGDGATEVSRDPNDYEMGAGTINMLEAGEDVKFSSPTHPNTGFDVFMKSLCEQVGAALEIPTDLLLMSFNSSYSASRAALMEAWRAFRMRREWLTDDFCRPVYEMWLTEAIARGRIIANGFFTDPAIRAAYLGANWIGAPQGMLDPTKELSAAKMAIEEGFTTRSAEAIKLNGSEYSANVAQLAIENEMLREANSALATATHGPTQTLPDTDDNNENDGGEDDKNNNAEEE